MSSNDHQALHENVLQIYQRPRLWNGVTVVDVHEYTKGEVVHPLINHDETGLTMALEEVGGVTEPRTSRDRACAIEHRPNHMTLAPKGMELWGHASADLRYGRYATLLFDLDVLADRFEEDFAPQKLVDPRFRFTNPRIVSLTKMLIGISETDPSDLLLGDSLTAAIFALLSTDDMEPAEPRQLSDSALSLIVEFIQDQLPRQIELRELANLAGLSQWHFARGFKRATGRSPYQWQLDKRLDLVQRLLLQTDAPLEAIARSAGFYDAMHMSRLFKRKTGEAPAAWRRTRK
jgi:AraC family transcriptional regulator